MTHAHENTSGKLRIGGGDAPVIMGASKWQTPYELWQIKLGIVPKPDLSNKKSVQFGKKLELFVLLEVLDQYNLPFDPGMREYWLESPLGDRVGYLDYRVSDDVFIEIKTTSVYAARDWEHGVPEYYLWQVVHYFSLMPTAKKAIVGCLIGGQDIVIHEVYRDEKLIAALLEEEYAFLAHLENKTEPPIGSMRVEGETYNMEPDVAEITLRYLEISKSITSLTKEQDMLKKALKQMVGEGNTQESESLRVSFDYRERTTLDEKAVVAAYPDIPWDNYKKTTGYYQITAKERKK